MALDSFNTPQPSPTQSKHPAVWDLVIRDMQDRDAAGTKKHGTRLQPHNGRDPLIDLYQELLDTVAYLRQLLYEKYEAPASAEENKQS